MSASAPPPAAPPPSDHADGGHEGHHHHHGADASTPTGKLLQALALSSVITVAQVAGGLISGSLALLSDALHTLTDGIALAVSYVAARIARTPASDRFTFGLRRAETLAAIINSGVLIGLSLWLGFEAIERFFHPEQIHAGVMIGVAAIGLVANAVNTVLLHRGAKDNLNVRSAYLHVMSDGVVSIAVILGGILILNNPALHWVDPLLTLLISCWLIYESWAIVWRGTRVLLMVAPDGAVAQDIRAALQTVPGVNDVHHIHLWVLNDRSIHFEAHVDVGDLRVSETKPLIHEIEEALEKWGVTHVTLQFECDRCCGEAQLVAAPHE